VRVCGPALASKRVDRDGEQARVFVCLFYLDSVQFCAAFRSGSARQMLVGGLTTGKSILVRCTGMVRYFHTPALAHGVVVEIHIGALVEAVMWGVVDGWGEVVVHICEAVRC
jgi:hypothetical protein